MPDNDPTETPGGNAAADAVDKPAPPKVTTRKRTAKKVTAKAPPSLEQASPEPLAGDTPVTSEAEAPTKKRAAPRKTAKKAAKAVAVEPVAVEAVPVEVAGVRPVGPDADAEISQEPAKKAAAKQTTAKRTTAKRATKKSTTEADVPPVDTSEATPDSAGEVAAAAAGAVPLFQTPEVTTQPRRRTRKKAGEATDSTTADVTTADVTAADVATARSTTGDTESEVTKRRTTKHDGSAADDAGESDHDEVSSGNESVDESVDEGEGSGGRRRRRRGGRRRRKPGDGESSDDSGEQEDEKDGQSDDSNGDVGDHDSPSSRRRRRRRRAGDEGAEGGDDPTNTVTRVRKGRNAADEITAVAGSTRLEAKKQRRREGREAGRRRAPIVSESEFLARRESVKRVMVIRQRGDVTQIGVLEDNVLVEHYVARESQTSLIGNVYLGRVQNVLPSMEAAFIDIGKGRNAVLYAGEVNWSALGHKEGQPRKVESVLSSGQAVLVQVTKDPIGHKGARLTSQVSLAGRFLVYVPDGTTSGISRKLPDTERARLKALLKEIVPETAGVIVRTAAEGAAEDELTRDVERLKARWDDIEKGAKKAGSGAQLLYGEPDLTLKVVRDLFTEDFAKLVIEGDDAWDTVQGYVTHVAPDLEDRLERYEPAKGQDVFAAYRIEEQIKKGLDRKVWLPSGGSLVIDRTEAMTVVDVNTGKFTGSGGNLEETVTKNNLEAAEEIVRQLRLRDIGGIIVVDFIDMVLESNRDLVLRRLVECLGRDRTRHQVAEVTSLGLVQMTRKRIGTGLLESFSHDCSACHGRGVVIEEAPVEPRKSDDEPRRTSRRSRGGKGRDSDGDPTSDNGSGNGSGRSPVPSPRDFAAAPRHEAGADLDAPESRDVAFDAPVDAAADPRSVSVEVPAEPVPAESAPAESVPAESAPAEPAGMDSEASSSESTVAATAETPAAAQPDVEQSVEQPDAEQPDARPAVVTRARRRSASRPAGPPAAAPDPVETSVATSPAAEEHPHDAAAHVPVKRRGGTRKR